MHRMERSGWGIARASRNKSVQDFVHAPILCVGSIKAETIIAAAVTYLVGLVQI